MQEKGQELDLEAKRGSKTKANHKLAGIFATYNIGEIYLMDMMTKDEQKQTKTPICTFRITSPNGWSNAETTPLC